MAQQIASDTFTRSNENPLNPSNWCQPGATQPADAQQIVSDYVEPSAAPSNNLGADSYYCGVASFPNNQYAQVAIHALNASSSINNGGVSLRAKALAGLTEYRGLATAGTGQGTGLMSTLVINKTVNQGTPETWVSQAPSVSLAADDVIQLEVIGSKLLLKQNGVVQAIGVDTAITSGFAGIHQFTHTTEGDTQLGPWSAGVPAPSYGTFSDNFTRANGPLGANYLTLDGLIAPTIVNDTASPGNTVGFGFSASIGTDYAADQYCSITVAAVSASNYGGCMVRASGDGAPIPMAASANFVGVNFYDILAINTTVLVQEVIGVESSGSYTSSTNLASYSVSVANGDTLELDVNGTTLTAKHNGTILGTATNSDIPDGNPGPCFYNFGAGGMTESAFSSGSFLYQSSITNGSLTNGSLQ